MDGSVSGPAGRKGPLINLFAYASETVPDSACGASGMTRSPGNYPKWASRKAAPAGAAAFGPNTAVAQSTAISEVAAALRTVSTVWARVRSDMVCDGIRAPKISTWAAARPARRGRA